ncbi:hypothetical protein AAG906_000474 [Vitis piasezkii]
MSRSHKVGYVVGVLITLALVCQARVHSHGGFVRTEGTRFVLDGSSSLFNGFNSYWMMHVAAEPSERYKVSNTFREAAGAGLSVCRTWAFSDGGDRALQISPGTYDERVFQALDFVISEARRYGIRLILSFVNNYKDYGGRPQYVEWARNAGVNVDGEDDFYTTPTVKEYYKNHVKRVITRFNTITRIVYKDDPTIMAWELMNEPRCQADSSETMVNGWVQEMASFVKSLDKNHLLEIGMEGFYGDSMPEKKVNNPGYQVGTDFISNNLIKEIDFTTIHAYPDIWLSGQNESAQMAFMQRWMQNQGYSLGARDQYLSTVYQSMNNFESTGGGISGSLVWQLMAEGMDSYGDGYGIILSQDASTRGKTWKVGSLKAWPHLNYCLLFSSWSAEWMDFRIHYHLGHFFFFFDLSNKV